MKLNTQFGKMEESYLFSRIGQQVALWQKSHPDADIIRLGIGDVTQPLCRAVVNAMQQAVAEMGEAATFRGYGPEQGYDFLRETIRDHYAGIGVALNVDEIFVSDGVKSDLGNFPDLFERDNAVLIPDPVYPAYVDVNVMAGREITYMNATEENGFLPMPDKNQRADLIYLCSPNNPTGAVYTREQLAVWVEYALEQKAIILFDAAYEAFIRDESLPRSIYEIPGARRCAVEFCSLSKTAGFTGTRCGHTVVPVELEADGLNLNKMWLRRQTTKYNGVPYIVQRGAQAVYSAEGQRQVRETLDYYLENAAVIGRGLAQCGISYTGGENSPYIWLRCPNGMASWEFFDHLLQSASVVGTPGAGFGQNGEGFFRLTGFGDRAGIEEAVARITEVV